jgi:hypothetical protein
MTYFTKDRRRYTRHKNAAEDTTSENVSNSLYHYDLRYTIHATHKNAVEDTTSDNVSNSLYHYDLRYTIHATHNNAAEDTSNSLYYFIIPYIILLVILYIISDSKNGLNWNTLYVETVLQRVTKLLTPKFYIFMGPEGKPEVSKMQG